MFNVLLMITEHGNDCSQALIGNHSCLVSMPFKSNNSSWKIDFSMAMSWMCQQKRNRLLLANFASLSGSIRDLRTSVHFCGLKTTIFGYKDIERKVRLCVWLSHFKIIALNLHKCSFHLLHSHWWHIARCHDVSRIGKLAGEVLCRLNFQLVWLRSRQMLMESPKQLCCLSAWISVAKFRSWVACWAGIDRKCLPQK